MAMMVEDANSHLCLPTETIRGIWNKAEKLLADPNAASEIPGGNPTDRFVLSKSGNMPHIIKMQKDSTFMMTSVLILNPSPSALIQLQQQH